MFATQKTSLNAFKSLLNRKNVPSKPSKNINEAENFLEIVTKGHILEAFLAFAGMDDISSQPSKELKKATQEQTKQTKNKHERCCFLATFTLPATNKPLNVKKQWLLGKVMEFVALHIDATFDWAHTFECLRKSQVSIYGTNLMSCGLLLWAHHDAVKEGNAQQMDSCWISLGSLFDTAHRTNYLREHFCRTLSLRYTLSARDSLTAAWNATVNMYGGPGGNVEIDKAQEFDNRSTKEASRHLGPNLNQKTMATVSESRQAVQKAVTSFDKALSVSPPSHRHSKPCDHPEILLVQETLKTHKVFRGQAQPNAIVPAQLSLHGIFQAPAGVREKVTQKTSHGKFALAEKGLFGLTKRETFKKTLTDLTKSAAARRIVQGVAAAFTAGNGVAPYVPDPAPFDAVDDANEGDDEIEDDEDDEDDNEAHPEVDNGEEEEEEDTL
jgi:hypothetical protein